MEKSASGTQPPSVEEVRKINDAVAKMLHEEPPTIGVVGVSGVGKSSTINALFKTELPTSDTVRCTTEFEAVDLSVEARHGTAKGLTAKLRVIDAPGLGEDVAQDPEYLRMYREYLPKCDVVLWVMAARNRAVALDQQYLKQLREFSPHIVFGLNQIDLVEPVDWNTAANLPSLRQEANIQTILEDRCKRMESVMGMPARMVAYGATRKYALVELFAAIIDACPDSRRWVFDAIRNVTAAGFLEGLSPQERKRVEDAARAMTSGGESRPSKEQPTGGIWQRFFHGGQPQAKK